MPKIDKLDIDLFRLPLPVAMGAAAAGVMTAFDMVTARVTDSDGVTGVGYTVMHEGQGGPIAAICDGSFRSSVEGRDPDLIETIWRDLYKRHHYAGRGGPVGFAMAAVDVALWDLKGNRLGTPLWRLLGGANPSVRAYAGNIDLNFPMNRLLEGGMASVEQGVPVGQDAARPPDHRRGHRSRRGDAQPSARRHRDDGGRERGLAGGSGDARHDAA